ncbi:purine-cytosine permease family protein [Lacisediminihabitans sp. FW035]
MDTDASARSEVDPGSDPDTGARRASFLPPIAQGAASPPADDSERYDDDMLAEAMADEAVRLGLTGAIQIMPPPTSPAVSTPLPPPMARAVATGRQAPEAPIDVEQRPSDVPPERPPVVAEADPPPAVTVTPVTPISLAGLPAPSGEPVVFEAEHPPVVSGSSLPTRRSIRDAEQARTREENAQRASGAADPPSSVDDTAPVAEVTLSPDFSPASDAPDSPGDFGDTSPVATVAPAAAAAPAFAPSTPPFYDLVEPQPYSAGPTVFPLGYRPQETGPAVVEGPAAPEEPVDVFAALIADPTPPTAYSARDLSPGEDFEAADEAALAARTASSPWLRSAAIDVVETSVPPQTFAPESSGSSPTPLDQRVGRASRLFWLWFAANSSVLSLALGGAIFSLGMSLRQAVVATFLGVAISFLPLGLGTLSGKWSGQPVMVVSRATFGHLGNILPASIALLTRLFWGAVLLWTISAATARILGGAKLTGPLTELQLMIIVMAVGFLLALVVAYFGYALFARIQLVLGILSAVLIVAFVSVTWQSVDFAKALTVADGPIMLVVTGVVLVFSFVGLVWANSSGDLARYQRPSSSGGASMLWASFGTTLPAFLLIGYGAVLAASNAQTADGLASNPIDTIAGLLPSWYPVPLIAATALSLLSGVVLSIYSGGFALGAIGLRVSRSGATVIVGVLVFAAAIVLGFSVSSVASVFRDLATTLAVPVAAWAGIFSAEMILRRRRFDTRSLVTRGGIYRDVNWLNLTMLVVASAVGLGLTSATVMGLRWEGYLFRAAGVDLSSPLGGTDLGVLVALALGLLTPLVAGISTIRGQERRQATRA